MLRIFVLAICCIIATSMLVLGPEPEPSYEKKTTPDLIDGVTMVAPPHAFPDNPMLEVKAIGADWISTVPYGFMRIGKPQIRFNTGRQWWGETEAGITKTIEYAHKNGVKVMLKPQIWSHTGWIGDQSFDSDADWKTWEKNYTEFILFYAEMAAVQEVEMFCIGTELKKHIAARPDYFHSLIKQIRTIYCGELIYSANWDSYNAVSFWDELDFIGLSAYFPLNENKTPSVDFLVKQWQPIEKELRRTSKKYSKKVLFTEYGYLSVDGSGGKTWLLEKNVKARAINEEAQANCFSALYQVFGDKSYWAGGFIWKWFPFGQGGEGYNERDYTPQGKLAESVIKRYYTKW